MSESTVYYPKCRVVLHIVFDGFGDTAADSEEFVIPVLPSKVTVHRNSYKQADSFDVSIDANDLPIDPDLIRSGSADVYLFESRELGDAFVLDRQNPLTSDSSLLSRDHADTIGLEVGLESSIQRFTGGGRPIVAGMFDDIHLEMGHAGRMVTFQGQDYTAYFAGRQWPPTANLTARRMPTGKRIDLIMEDLLREADPRHIIRLVTPGLDRTKLPVVGAAETAGPGHGRGIPVETSTTYWDVMYKLAIRCGLIVFIDGTDLVLTRPHHITTQNEASIRVLRYGRDIESLDMSRKLGKECVPTIIVQGRDPKTRKPIFVEFPKGGRTFTKSTAKIAKADVKTSHETTKFKAPKKAVAHHKKPGTKTTTVHKKDEYQIIPAYGISDPAILRDMAEGYFHLLGRAERKVVVKTKDLRDLRDADLLSLKNGDAVAINFEDFNRELLANKNVPRDSKIGHLLARGYGDAIARVIVDHTEKFEQLKEPLRVREVTFTYGTTEGIAIELELVNFVLLDDDRREEDREPSRSLMTELRHAGGRKAQ